ncbi:hypothetical protein V6N13_099428 [Hibiscus sabdariffa]
MRILSLVGKLQVDVALTGDFNVVRGPQESSDFDDSHVIIGPMQEFIDCMDGLDVVDHVFTSHVFTWCNKHEDALLSRKLDRVLVN